MTGRIHSFQSLGTVDGPGLRCVVFTQGCPLRCVCCHNPDTWDLNGGEETDTDTLIAKILRFRNFFGEKGGVTVSGGEPLLQAEFVTELFAGLKENGINTALDTSGCIFNEKTDRLLDYTDLVLLDSKYPDAEGYRKYTGCEKEKADFFLAKLEEKKIPVWLRRVIIPGLTDSEESVLQLKKQAEKYSCVEKTELLPFRKFCVEKYKELKIPFPLEDTPEPTAEQMEKLEKILYG